MKRAGFAKMVGSSNAAKDWHFIAGYEETFDSTTDDSSVQIAVMQFTSPTTATNYDVGTVRAYAAEGMITTHTAGLATSLDLNSPAADSTGHYLHLVIMHKAERVVVILYYNRTRGPGRLATSIARQEYARV